VIDEIDVFEAYENSFRTFTKAILASKTTNTILIGIANSVDLPFKKKHSAIAMRDAQLLFEPYSEEQIISIIEEKINMKFRDFPLRITQNTSMKKIFFNLIDDRAKDIIAKKVSKMNGDIRVAFDIIKSSLVELYNRIKYQDNGKEERKEDEPIITDQIRVSLELVIEVFKDKYGSKLPETLKCLPRQNLIVLEAIVNLYADSPFGEDRKLSYHEL
jgi:Cdc6-like AAA superfamily ATPase